jgi:DNA-binding transcriptional ArsR family regulator
MGAEEVAIIRVQHDLHKPFLMVSRELLADTHIDLQAKGLLIYMLDKPDDFSVRPEVLARELKVSRPTVYRLLAKLRDAKYVNRTDIHRRKSDGTFDSTSIYDVFENRKDAEIWDERVPF